MYVTRRRQYYGMGMDTGGAQPLVFIGDKNANRNNKWTDLYSLLRFSQMAQNQLDSTLKWKWITAQSILQKTPRSFQWKGTFLNGKVRKQLFHDYSKYKTEFRKTHKQAETEGSNTEGQKEETTSGDMKWYQVFFFIQVLKRLLIFEIYITLSYYFGHLKMGNCVKIAVILKQFVLKFYLKKRNTLNQRLYFSHLILVWFAVHCGSVQWQNSIIEGTVNSTYLIILQKKKMSSHKLAKIQAHWCALPSVRHWLHASLLPREPREQLRLEVGYCARSHPRGCSSSFWQTRHSLAHCLLLLMA